MKNSTLLLLSCLLLFNPLFGRDASQQIYSNSGDISAPVNNAFISNAGLIVESGTWKVINLSDYPGIKPQSTIRNAKLPSLNSNQILVFSNHGNHVARLTLAGAGDYYEVSLAEVFNSYGELIYEIESPGFSEAVITDFGRMIGLKRNINIAEKSEILFFNESGDLLRREKFPFLNQVKIDKHGYGIGAISGKRGLVIFNMEGQELLQLGQCQWFDLYIAKSKPPGDYYSISCVYSNGNNIGYYTNIGEEINWDNTFGSEIFRDIKVRNHGKKIEIAAISKHNLYHINARSGEILWEHKVQAPVSLTSCDISGRADVFIAWGWEIDEGRSVPQNQRHVRGGFSLAEKEYLRKDFVTHSEDLSYTLWNVFTPKVEFIRNGLMIQTRNEVRFLQLNNGGFQR